MKKLFLLLVAVLTMGLCAAAQNRTVSGTVYDEEGEPVMGASVVPVGSRTGVVTDADGNFAISVPQNVKALEFSYIGLQAQRVNIGKGRMLVTLKNSIETKDEVIVVAYGTAKRSEYTGSASVVKAGQIENAQAANVVNVLAGKVSGVQLQSSYGAPGSQATVRIRGVGSINAGSSPLYVVDGMPYDGDISAIAPSDIAEMTVLKDAASTALYGARGANGVILITTKKGNEGNARVVLDMRLGSNSRSLANYNTIDDPRQYVETLYRARMNTLETLYGITDKMQAHQIANFGGALPKGGSFGSIWDAIGYQTWTTPEGQDIVGTNGKFNPLNTPGYVKGNYMYRADDWRDETFIHGFRQEYNLSISGGTDKLQYYVSGSYLGDDGIIKSSHYKRFSTRANVDYQAKKWLKIGTNLSYAYQDSGAPGDQDLDASTSVGNAFNAALHLGPVFPMYIRDPQGAVRIDPTTGNPIYDYGDGKDYGWGRTPSRNRLSSANPVGDLVFDLQQSLADVFSAKWYAQITPYKDLNVIGSVGYNVDNTRLHYIKNPLYGSGQDYKGQAIQAHDRYRTLNLNILANWNHTWNDVHTVDLMASFENSAYNEEDVEASGNNLYQPHSPYVNNTIDNKMGYGYAASLVHRGFLARAKYNYAGKYYVVGSIRRDASSRFHKNHRWGTFWSASIGWDISQENFLKESTVVDMLKFKASFGQTGNDGIGTRYLAWDDQYKITGADGVWSDGTLSYKGNKDITWETSNSFNTGFDYSFFKGMLTGTLEYYQRDTHDMLFNVPVAPSLGYSSVPRNVGSMRNNGFEFDINYRAINTRDITLDINANITTGWNKVTKLPEDILNTNADWRNDSQMGWLSGSRIFFEGQSAYALWTVEYAGVNNDPNLLRNPGTAGDDTKVPLGAPLYKALKTKMDSEGNPVVYSYKKDANGQVIVDEATGKPIVDQYAMEEYLTDNRSAAYNTNRKSTGNLMPKAYGGFGFDLKAYGFDLSMSFAYQFGGKIMDSAYMTYMSAFDKNYVGQAYHKDLLNAWTPNNTNTDVPALAYESPTGSAYNSVSTRFLISSNYLSLNNITVGYTIPAKWTTRIALNDVRLYFSAENVALWSKRKGMDPRQGFTSSDNSTYSPIRALSGGIRVSF